jgi:peptide chain release factor 2
MAVVRDHVGGCRAETVAAAVGRGDAGRPPPRRKNAGSAIGRGGRWRGRVVLSLVTDVDLAEQLKTLDATLRNIETVLDLPRMRKEKADLEEQASAPDLWDDQTRAQQLTSRLSYVQGELNRLEKLRSRVDDAAVLLELAQSEEDAGTRAEAAAEIAALLKSVDELEVRTLLSGEYDAREALITIRSGAGGVDAADFAEMLLRMYLRWAERHGYSTDVYDTSYAEEAGLKSATFAVKAPYAYGTLSVEGGTHRLVRISPFDNQGRRQTSFAAVEVVPVVEQTDEIDISDDDLRVDVYRSSGPGGQGVNTTDSAVRITHLPTGIVVSCQNERSQLQNKATAMGVLKAKLLALKRAEEQAKMDAIRGDVAGSWGDQMRSYVLHPYQMVKDLRTEYETGNPTAVFDGEIDPLIEAGIRWRKQRQMAGDS